MPYKLWGMQLKYVQPGCRGNLLTGAGQYKTVRTVLDIDGYYYMGTEYLECRKGKDSKGCGKRYTAWNEVLLRQLVIGHRSYFPALLTYR